MSSSPSTSSSPEAESTGQIDIISEKSCQVCGSKAHGAHFGAITCRACAAFFRRVAAGSSFVIKCRTGGGDCEIVQNGRSCCKKCRLKKCQDIGMDIQNFQYHRDPISTSRRVAQSLANFLGRPQFIIFCDSETASKNHDAPNYVDVSVLVEKASRILEKPQIAWGSGRNRLQTMAFSLNIDQVLNEKELLSVGKIGLLETMSFWEHDFLNVATWLTHFHEFQELEKDVKLKFLKCMWHIWNRLEKLARSSLMRKAIPKDSVVLGADCVLKLSEMRLDIGWLTNFSLEQVAYYIEGVGDLSIFEIVEPMMELDPSEVEVTFMLAQLSFEYAGQRLQGEMLETSERLQEILSNDLHDYYVKVMDMPRYSDRVRRMMKINNMMREFIWKRREKMSIAKTFDIFNVQFSEPEMFSDIY